MAAVATDTIEIKINDIAVQVPKGELIVESVKRLGLEVPVFCYHPRMKPVGMCRMCIIEVGFVQPDGSVRKMPKPQAACTLPASENMVIYTDSEMVHRDRKGVLEFLLINHPLDCPICDRGGECPLQNNTLFYGPSTSRFVELKRHLPKAYPLSQYVTLDLERCIQCGRCVRFTEEISGDSELAFRFRGASMQPSTFELRNFGSKFSGNVIEICPVGALTSGKYRFRARPWDLETKPAICTLCSNGCSIWFDHRAGKLVRVNGRTNDAVNGEWTCDKGKFGHDFYNSPDRVTQPLIRRGGALVPCSWPEAYTELLSKFEKGGDKVAFLGGADLSNEDIYTAKSLFTETFGSQNIDHRFEAELKKRGHGSQSTIASLESGQPILVFGTSLATDLPMFYLRVRKSWFDKGTKVVVAYHEATEVDTFAHTILRYKEGTENILAQALAGDISEEDAATKTGVTARLIAEAKAILTEGTQIVVSSGLYNAKQAAACLEQLEKYAASIKGSLGVYAKRLNETGASELGLTPGKGGKNSSQILEACKSGEIEALWIAGTDPLEVSENRAMVEAGLEKVPFLVVQTALLNEVASFASVVLPMCAPAEAEGTYTNAERRVQRLRQVLPSLGEAKPAWKVFAELQARLGNSIPFFGPAEVMDRIAKECKPFARCTYPEIPLDGALLG